MPLQPVLTSIIGWLRAGYPEGVPERDYIPLFALLASQLSDSEVTAIADELAGAGDPVSARAIREASLAAEIGPLNESEVARVSAKLAAVGWPLAGPVHREEDGETDQDSGPGQDQDQDQGQDQDGDQRED